MRSPGFSANSADISFSGCLETLSRFTEALARLGIYAKPGSRLVLYQQLMEHALSTPGNSFSIDASESPLYYSAMEDISQWRMILTHIDWKDRRWHPKIQTMLSGHANPFEDRNPLARNTQAELYLAATFGRAGILVTPPESSNSHVDFVASFKGWRFAVEAKRLTSDSRVGRACKKATAQIKKARLPGLIAIEPSMAIQSEEPHQLRMSIDQAKLSYWRYAHTFFERHRFTIKKLCDQDFIAGVTIIPSMWFYDADQKIFASVCGTNTYFPWGSDPKLKTVKQIQHRFVVTDRTHHLDDPLPQPGFSL